MIDKNLMNTEEKQMLIEIATKRLNQSRRMIEAQKGSVRPRDGIEIDYGINITLMEIVLAALTAQPVLYALRFKNHHGQPDKLINQNCVFRNLEEASKYGKGGNYVEQASGKLEWVPNPSLDPEVIPLFTAGYEVQK